MNIDNLFKEAYGKRLALFLAGGQHIIADFQEQTEEGYLVKDPLVLQHVQTPDGNPALAVQSLSPFIDKGDKFLLMREHIFAISPVTNKNLINAYLDQTGGVIIPNMKGVPTIPKAGNGPMKIVGR